MSFDPDAAAQPGSGIFGLDCERKDSRVILLPVPFDATTSYRRGTSLGPAAIFRASAQVDLYDRRMGRIYERGIHMIDEVDRLWKLSEETAEHAASLIEAGGARPEDASTVRKIDVACEEVNAYVYAEVRKILRENKIPGVIGGEHSVPFGAIRACAEHHEKIGLLHIDAHMDFRDAFEGMTWSHASIMHNVMSRVPGVTKIVQVGIRDFGERELEFATRLGDRCVVHFDDAWGERLLNAEPFSTLIAQAIDPLPEKVYVSFDIDALEPSLCPNTGTPVPGGLSFTQASLLLDALRTSGRTVVGFDLVEVAPSHDDDAPELDGNVGARILYKLCGLA